MFRGLRPFCRVHLAARFDSSVPPPGSALPDARRAHGNPATRTHAVGPYLAPSADGDHGSSVLAIARAALSGGWAGGRAADGMAALLTEASPPLASSLVVVTESYAMERLAILWFREALATLPRRQQEVFGLRLLGFTNVETAALLSLSPRTTMNVFTRTRRRLSELALHPASPVARSQRDTARS